MDNLRELDGVTEVLDKHSLLVDFNLCLSLGLALTLRKVQFWLLLCLEKDILQDAEVMFALKLVPKYSFFLPEP